MPKKYAGKERLFIYLPQPDDPAEAWEDSNLLLYAYIVRTNRSYVAIHPEKISKHVRLSPAAIRRALKSLEKINYIKVIARNRKKGHIVTIVPRQAKPNFIVLDEISLKLYENRVFTLKELLVIETLLKTKKTVLNYFDGRVEIMATDNYFTKTLKVSRITVWRTIKKLQKVGLVEVKTRGRFKSGKRCRYRSISIKKGELKQKLYEIFLANKSQNSTLQTSEFDIKEAIVETENETSETNYKEKSSFINLKNNNEEIKRSNIDIQFSASLGNAENICYSGYVNVNENVNSNVNVNVNVNENKNVEFKREMKFDDLRVSGSIKPAAAGFAGTASTTLENVGRKAVFSGISLVNKKMSSVRCIEEIDEVLREVRAEAMGGDGVGDLLNENGTGGLNCDCINDYEIDIDDPAVIYEPFGEGDKDNEEHQGDEANLSEEINKIFNSPFRSYNIKRLYDALRKNFKIGGRFTMRSGYSKVDINSARLLGIFEGVDVEELKKFEIYILSRKKRNQIIQYWHKKGLVDVAVVVRRKGKARYIVAVGVKIKRYQRKMPMDWLLGEVENISHYWYRAIESSEKPEWMSDGVFDTVRIWFYDAYAVGHFGSGLKITDYLELKSKIQAVNVSELAWERIRNYAANSILVPVIRREAKDKLVYSRFTYRKLLAYVGQAVGSAARQLSLAQNNISRGTYRFIMRQLILRHNVPAEFLASYASKFVNLERIIGQLFAFSEFHNAIIKILARRKTLRHGTIAEYMNDIMYNIPYKLGLFNSLRFNVVYNRKKLFDPAIRKFLVNMGHLAINFGSFSQRTKDAKNFYRFANAFTLPWNKLDELNKILLQYPEAKKRNYKKEFVSAAYDSQALASVSLAAFYATIVELYNTYSALFYKAATWGSSNPLVIIRALIGFLHVIKNEIEKLYGELHNTIANLTILYVSYYDEVVSAINSLLLYAYISRGKVFTYTLEKAYWDLKVRDNPMYLVDKLSLLVSGKPYKRLELKMTENLLK